MVSICGSTPLDMQMFNGYLSNYNGQRSIVFSQNCNDLHGMTVSSDISESDLSNPNEHGYILNLDSGQNIKSMTVSSDISESDLSNPNEHGYILNLDSGQNIKNQIGFQSTHSEGNGFSDDESVILDVDDLEFLDNCVTKNCWQLQANDNYTQSESKHQLNSQGLPCFDELTRQLRTEDIMSREQKISYNLHLLEEDENVMCRKGKRDFVFHFNKIGAKHVLLWKFLLEKLRDSPDLVRWTDRENGLFRFVDTIEISRQWGIKKGKGDMTFEKLSRAIRHYYKSGFMSRKEGTRLVYKINWKMVPKAYR
ncbi:hypothetical protein KUTeg_023552 [Tegillarca granosa]|uniref:ETS domain-containing protein n=1 Tax=Tegillarca granosa TaxID=220873 RepID=A0ABQ9E6K0_TEGGR|nr:hypothetical protein KUTeg_023552 [Tegillarca granosa]